MRSGKTFANKYSDFQRRILAETELAILAGLANPWSVQRIPFMEVGVGAFEPEFARAFWSATLGLDHQQEWTGEASRSSCGDRRFGP
jgi:hypothetical protein